MNMKPTGPKKNDDGFTLVELMLASSILAVVLTGLIQLFLACRYLNESNQNLVVAVAHAQFVTEAIKGSSTSVSTIEAAINNGSWNLSSDDLVEAPYEFSGLYNESVTAEVFQPGNPLGFNVTVRWRQGSMVDHEYVIRTAVSQ